MVKKIFGVFVVIVLTISAINAMLYYRLKGTISNKTEEKYVRNFEKYKLLNDHIASTKDIGSRDTLSFMAKIPLCGICYYGKWYINRVGIIPRNSRLSHLLDSLSSTYIPPSNKYK